MIQEKNVLYKTTNKGNAMLDKLKDVSMGLFEGQETETSDKIISNELVSKNPILNHI
jgi:hypothetical protein